GPAGESIMGGAAIWLRSPCLGQCDRAPAALAQRAGVQPADWTLTGVTSENVIATLRGEVPLKPDPSGFSPSAAGVFAAPPRLLRRVGVADPQRLDSYRAHGGYEALAKALQMGPTAVIREVMDARLVGRGGALFPAGRKWDAVAQAPARPHYLVCNADESEPGTFKDRVLMEEDPFAVIEAMTIAGFATGCEQGYIYVRGEYPMATDR